LFFTTLYPKNNLFSPSATDISDSIIIWYCIKSASCVGGCGFRS
jgi:hypothetical protein